MLPLPDAVRLPGIVPACALLLHFRPVDNGGSARHLREVVLAEEKERARYQCNGRNFVLHLTP